MAEEERTSLFGGPIVRQHDHHTNMMLAIGGGLGAFTGAGGNTLPPGYTDRSLVRIPIKESSIEGEPTVKPEKKSSFLRRLSGIVQDKTGGEEITMVTMSRGDFLKYWAKGEDGQFLPNVVAPPEGRREWVRRQLELNEEWRRNDPTLMK